MAIKGAGNKMVRSSNYIGSISRTAFPRLYDFRNTFSAGHLFPIYADEVYPGSNKKLDVGALVRSITPLGPVMDKSFLDIFFFFVPSRLVWDHFEEFIAGFNKEAWTQGIEYKKPKIIFHGSETAVDSNAYLHSFLDFLPGACDVVQLAEYQSKGATLITGESMEALEDSINRLCWIDALYPRSYVKIWNDWFRDENLQDEYELYTGDNDEYADEFAFNLLSPLALPKAAKYHNRFTSALPAPVKGPDVLIPMTGLQLSDPTLPVGVVPNATRTLSQSSFPYFLAGTSLTKDTFKASNFLDSNDSSVTGKAVASTAGVVANNVSNTIRMLRVAVQTEKLLARDARGGTRFCESILSHFGVHNGDARLQRSEYLGSVQIPLQVQQVTNTTQAEGSALGNVGGQSVTRFNKHVVNAAFSEWGIVLGLAVVRTNISYSSGIRKIYQREARFDHIWPEFKHIGDVPLYTKELELHDDMVSASTSGTNPDYWTKLVFGYTPYASEKREGYNFNTGLFRHKASGSLDYLTYQEKYDDDNEPSLSGEWIEQPTDIVSDTLVDQSGPQYYALWEISEVAVEPLDPTSDPGLMDHF